MSTTAALRDRYDLPLTTSSLDAVERYVEGIDRLLSQNAGADESFAAALAADDGFALGHAAMAAAQQARGNPAAARESAARARELTGGISRRERQHVDAIATIVNGNASAALPLVDEHLAEFPRDVLLVHQANTIYQFGGLEDRQRRHFDFFARLTPAYGDDWYFLSAFSFVHHELDRFEESRQLSERSLARYPTNANAAHDLGHVFYETNDHAGGVAFLSDWLTSYERRAPMHCHLSWHLALFELSSGHYQQAIAIYRSSVSPAVTTAHTTLYDAASFLWRWQIYGCAGGAALPWQEVCDLAGRTAAQPGLAFADVHAALAYAAAGDEMALGRLVDGLQALGAKGHPLAGTVTLPLVNGIVAFAHGEYEDAIRSIESVKDQIVRIGGSNAQREVIQDTLLEAYLRANRFEQAEALLRRRLARRPSARDLFWLGRAQSATGHEAEATESVSAARSRWRTLDSEAPEQQQLAALEARLSRN